MLTCRTFELLSDNCLEFFSRHILYYRLFLVVVGQQLVIILQPWSYNISFSSSYVGVYTPEKVATSLNTSKLFQQGKPFTSLTRVCGCFI